MDGRMLAGLAVLWVGCGGGGDAPGVAEDWYRSVADGDEAAACQVMEPTAVDALRAKYTRLPETSSCEVVVEEYAGMMDRAKAEAILDGGFEVGEPTRSGDIGVFPATEPYDLQIILMRELQGKWRVISVNISPS